MQSNIIVSIILGPGTYYDKIQHINLSTGEKEMISVPLFMSRLMDDVMKRITQSPFAAVSPESEWLAIDKHYANNCRTLRGYFGDIIDKIKQKKDTNAQDIVSLLLQDENYQNREDIIDDIIVMYIAGSRTVQTTTSNLITSLIFNPEYYKKLHEETDPFMERVKDDIMGKMNLEDIEELEYVK